VKLTAELSLYPLQEEYIPVIEAFIGRVREGSDLQVVTNAMSTQVCGEWQQVMDVVGTALRESSEHFGRQVLVCKFIPGDLGLED